MEWWDDAEGATGSNRHDQFVLVRGLAAEDQAEVSASSQKASSLPGGTWVTRSPPTGHITQHADMRERHVGVGRDRRHRRDREECGADQAKNLSRCCRDCVRMLHPRSLATTSSRSDTILLQLGTRRRKLGRPGAMNPRRTRVIWVSCRMWSTVPLSVSATSAESVTSATSAGAPGLTTVRTVPC